MIVSEVAPGMSQISNQGDQCMQLLNGGLVSFLSSHVSLLSNKCLLGEQYECLTWKSQSSYSHGVEGLNKPKVPFIIQLFLIKKKYHFSQALKNIIRISDRIKLCACIVLFSFNFITLKFRIILLFAYQTVLLLQILKGVRINQLIIDSKEIVF